MVTDQELETVLESISRDQQKAQKAFLIIHEHYDEVFSYIYSSYDAVFNDSELELIDFGAFVILASIYNKENNLINIDQLIEHDESNLALIEKDKSISFENRLDSVYDDFEEKTLLEFIIEFVFEENKELPSLTKDIVASFLFSLLKSREKL